MDTSSIAMLPRLFLPTMPSKTIWKITKLVKVRNPVVESMFGTGKLDDLIGSKYLERIRRCNGSLAHIPIVSSITAETPDFCVLSTDRVPHEYIELANSTAKHVSPEPKIFKDIALN